MNENLSDTIIETNSDDIIDCCICFDIVIQSLPPSLANFANKNSCNMGCFGQINDPRSAIPQRHTFQ